MFAFFLTPGVRRCGLLFGPKETCPHWSINSSKRGVAHGIKRGVEGVLERTLFFFFFFLSTSSKNTPKEKTRSKATTNFISFARRHFVKKAPHISSQRRKKKKGKETKIANPKDTNNSTPLQHSKKTEPRTLHQRRAFLLGHVFVNSPGGGRAQEHQTNETNSSPTGAGNCVLGLEETGPLKDGMTGLGFRDVADGGFVDNHIVESRGGEKGRNKQEPQRFAHKKRKRKKKKMDVFRYP